MDHKRRKFIKQVSTLAAMQLILPVAKAIDLSAGKDIKILLRSSWQTINIGDIGHTFGIMELFKEYFPKATIVLWPNKLDRGVDELMRRSFPQLTILDSQEIEANPQSAALQKAFDECTLMIHGSGPSIVEYKALQAWWEATHKPFGIYGVTLDELSDPVKDLVNNASFFFCRDTASLNYLKTLHLRCPVQQFGPDATFSIQIRNEKKAASYLSANGLNKGEFICAIPRLRYTPNWKIKGRTPTDEDKWKDEVSALFQERDAAKLREVIVHWVRKTGLKVLVCPEVTYQVAFSKELIVDRLPVDVRQHIVWRDNFWLTDEAASVYASSRALVSFEPHSPIIALVNKVPSIHLRQPSDTRKGQMFVDIGLSDWYFHIDETPATQITAALMDIHLHYPEALEKLNKAMSFVRQVQQENMRVIKKSIV